MRELTHRIDHYERNPNGRDLIVGDIHGCFSKLQEAMNAVAFDPQCDRLFSVGDLVDRGPESHHATAWLRQPWFKAVRGNHEEAAIAWADGKISPDHYAMGFGGGWNIGSEPARCAERAKAFEQLPIAIELETPQGLVIIVHADCPTPTWAECKVRLLGDTPMPVVGHVVANAMVWSRNRHERLLDGPVKDVRAVVVGHQPVQRFTSLGNVLFIDTEGWGAGRFTIIDASDLRPASAVRLLWK